MKRIYKFPLEITGSETLLLPVGAEILTVQFQGETLCLWALVNGGLKQTETRRIAIFGTGEPISDDVEMQYIATVQQFGGQLVWHVFEIL